MDSQRLDSIRGRNLDEFHVRRNIDLGHRRGNSQISRSILARKNALGGRCVYGIGFIDGIGAFDLVGPIRIHIEHRAGDFHIGENHQSKARFAILLAVVDRLNAFGNNKLQRSKASIGIDRELIYIVIGIGQRLQGAQLLFDGAYRVIAGQVVRLHVHLVAVVELRERGRLYHMAASRKRIEPVDVAYAFLPTEQKLA